MNAKRNPIKHPPVSVPSPTSPGPLTPTAAGGDGPAADNPWSIPPFPRPEPPPPVAPARVLDAARAAFEVADAYRSPHAETLLFLAERLAGPTSSGLPDPFAPALRVLAQTLYGPSNALWEKATEAFRRRYLSSGGSPRGAEAAVRRWQALADLGPQDRTTLHGWCLSQAAGRGPDRVCALVVAAAREPLWPMHPWRTSPSEEFFPPESLIAAAGLVEQGGLATDAHDRAVRAVWNGLFGGRLGTSFRALSPLFQAFLRYLIVQIGAGGTVPQPTHKVWADDLAQWAGLEPGPVRAAFVAREDPIRSPAYGLSGTWTVLPDALWSDFANPPRLEVGWLDAPSTVGQSDGCPWQEVTLTRELLPYLRRLHLYLDQMPLAAHGNRR